MVKRRITLIPGDGIGPEVIGSAKACIEAAGIKINWEEHIIGEKALKQFKTPLPEQAIKAIKKNKVCLKGPVTTPVGTGFRSVNVALRQALELYANVRPAKYYPGVKTLFRDIDLVVVRENTEDLYAGIEFEKGKAVTKKFIAMVKKLTGKSIAADAGISLKPNSVRASDLIAKFAFEYAKKHSRKKITAVHKANILKFSDGLFLNSAQRMARKYPKIEFEDRIIDAMCAQLVLKPHLYDMLLCPNLYGDIISDLCAGLVGGLGLAPSGNIGSKAAVFEPVHGSAPKYAGKNKVNPTAAILAGVMMLQHIGENKAAQRIERAVAAVIKEGKKVTYDLTVKRPVGTKQMTAAIIDKI